MRKNSIFSFLETAVVPGAYPENRGCLLPSGLPSRGPRLYVCNVFSSNRVFENKKNRKRGGFLLESVDD